MTWNTYCAKCGSTDVVVEVFSEIFVCLACGYTTSAFQYTVTIVDGEEVLYKEAVFTDEVEVNIDAGFYEYYGENATIKVKAEHLE